MATNPILEELHAARAKLLNDAGGDLGKLVRGIQERQVASGHRVVSVPLRPVKQPEDVTAGKV